MSEYSKVEVLDRALRILQAIACQGRPIGVTEISKELDIPKAAVYRILQTLEGRDFVIQFADSQLYYLGFEVLRLSDKFHLNPALIRIALPHMERLSILSGEVVNLGVLIKNKVVIIRSVSGRDGSRLNLNLGSIADIHSSSLGKSLIYDKSPDFIRSLLGDSPLQSYTPKTKTTLGELLKEIEIVRSVGYSMDNEETEVGLICVGAPIFDWNENIIAAISISAPRLDLIDEKIEEFKRLVPDTASNISRELKGQMNNISESTEHNLAYSTK